MITGWYMIRLENGNYLCADGHGVPFTDALWVRSPHMGHYTYGTPERISGCILFSEDDFKGNLWITRVVVNVGHLPLWIAHGQ